MLIAYHVWSHLFLTWSWWLGSPYLKEEEFEVQGRGGQVTQGPTAGKRQSWGWHGDDQAAAVNSGVPMALHAPATMLGAPCGVSHWTLHKNALK